jgi:DNA-directed RNA polymerase II subunit RPB2
VKVFVNGRWVGTHNNADDLVHSIKALRRSLEIPKEISIVRDITNKEVRFFTDSGRVQRPLFIVRDSQILLRKEHITRLLSRQHDSINFDETLKLGLCEFLDVEEEETAMIAMHISDLRNKGRTNHYTHCEIHPSMILGVCASIIPFPDHN